MIIYRMKAMVHLMQKQEKIHKKVMKLLKEMIELHNHVFESQLLTNELRTVIMTRAVTRRCTRTGVKLASKKMFI